MARTGITINQNKQCIQGFVCKRSLFSFAIGIYFSLDKGLLMGASVVSLPRNGITTQSLDGVGRLIVISPTPASSEIHAWEPRFDPIRGDHNNGQEASQRALIRFLCLPLDRVSRV